MASQYKDGILQELIEYAGEDYKDDDLSFLINLVEDAAEEVRDAMYPLGSDDYEKSLSTAYERYPRKIRKIAEYHYDKRGKEGTKSWMENGDSYVYEDSGTPKSYFVGIIPESVII